MSRPIAVQSVALLLLLGPCVAGAATATVSASNPTPAVGDSFTVTVSGAGFPGTAGATLGLTWNAAVVSVTGVLLAPASPFADLLADPPYDLITILAPIAGAAPSGSFDAFEVTFTAVAPGEAGITVVDNGADQSWVDADTVQPIPVTWTQAQVTVATPATPTTPTESPLHRFLTPAPAAVWLFGSALAVLGLVRRRQGS